MTTVVADFRPSAEAVMVVVPGVAVVRIVAMVYPVPGSTTIEEFCISPTLVTDEVRNTLVALVASVGRPV